MRLSSLFAFAITALVCSTAFASSAEPKTDGYVPPSHSVGGVPLRREVEPAWREPETETKVGWYGWQILAVDAAALTIGGVGHEHDALVYGAVGTYFAGAPLVHYAHDRPWHAAGSVAMRATFPLIGMMITASGESHDVSGLSVLLGLVVGVGAAMAIDAGPMSLTFEEKPVTPATGLRVMPSIAATKAFTGVGLIGTF
jgi:hypothetical protein